MDDGMMPDPTDVPESTNGFVLMIEEFDNAFVAHGLMGLVASDKTRDGAIEKLRKLTIRQVDGPNHSSGLVTPAASPVAPPENKETYYRAATRALLVGLRAAIEELCLRDVRVPDSAEAVFAEYAEEFGLDGGSQSYQERHSQKVQRAKLASPVAGGSARIAEIASRLAAITPGPWVFDPETTAATIWEGMAPSGSGTPGRLVATVIGDDMWVEPNAEFIAAAPEDIAFLLKLVPEGWVKVTPETPAIHEDVLITYKGKTVPAYLDAQRRYWIGEGGITMDTEDVRYWRHRPPPAAEEERSSL